MGGQDGALGWGPLRAVSRVSNEGASRVLSSSSSSPPASVNTVSFCWAAGRGRAQVRNRKAGRGERAATGGGHSASLSG